MKHVALIILVFLTSQMLAQGTPTSTPPQSAPAAPAWSPSKDIGVFVFGKNGQTPDQQLKDESECYGAARQMSGIDPKAPAAPGKTDEQKAAEQKEAAENAEQVRGARVAGAEGLREAIQFELRDRRGSAPRHATHSQERSGGTRCTTAVNARAYSRA